MNTQMNIVGLRHHVAPQLLTQWFENEPNSEFSLYEQPLCLMRAHQCSQDEHAVMAVGLGQGVVGYVSRVDARRCADALRQSATPHLQARVVGCDKVRRSLVVEVMDPLPESEPDRPVDWHYDDNGPVMRLPECFVCADHDLMWLEMIAGGQAAMVSEEQLEQLAMGTINDLSADATLRRKKLAETMAASSDPRLRAFSSRLWALMDHMGSDELMERWTHEVLASILEGKAMRHCRLRYPELTLDELTDRVRNMPNGLGRDWLAGDRVEFVRRMYYQQISRRQMMHLLTLVSMYEWCKADTGTGEGMGSLTGSATGIPSLDTAQARTFFDALQTEGLLDKRLQPVRLSVAERGMLVGILARRLKLTYPWRDFGKLWNMNSETLRKGCFKAHDQKQSLDFHDRLKKLLDACEKC